MYYVYDEKGAIFKIFDIDAKDIPLNIGSSENYIEHCEYLDKHIACYYVTTDGKIIERPILSIGIDKTDILANGVDTATISNIPPGTRLLTPYGEFDLTSDTVAITHNVAETFTVTVQCWPYLDKEITIHAN